jgi:hypothetical protein
MTVQWLDLERWHGRSPRTMSAGKDSPGSRRFARASGGLDVLYVIDVERSNG